MKLSWVWVSLSKEKSYDTRPILKDSNPYSTLDIIVLTRDNSTSIHGFKVSVLAELIEHDFSSLEDYEIYSIDLAKGFYISEDGDDSRDTYAIRLIVKEKY